MTVMSLYAECNDAGGMARHTFDNDPQRLGFVLARYKHTAKMLHGYNNVLEVGCSDGFASRVVRQHVKHLKAVDIDADAIEIAKKEMCKRWPIKFSVGDIQAGNYHDFHAVYALDVIEHIANDESFLIGMAGSAEVAVIGTPSIESQMYASELSRAGHVNCMTGPMLKRKMQEHWKHVFVFSMNDETLHTGFYPMAHYLLALGCEPK